MGVDGDPSRRRWWHWRTHRITEDCPSGGAEEGIAGPRGKKPWREDTGGQAPPTSAGEEESSSDERRSPANDSERRDDAERQAQRGTPPSLLATRRPHKRPRRGEERTGDCP